MKNDYELSKILEKEINDNFILDEEYKCYKCGNNVYIKNEFERLPKLIEKKGIESFKNWFINYNIEIDECPVCSFTLDFHGKYPDEEKKVKKWILDILN